MAAVEVVEALAASVAERRYSELRCPRRKLLAKHKQQQPQSLSSERVTMLSLLAVQPAKAAFF